MSGMGDRRSISLTEGLTEMESDLSKVYAAIAKGAMRIARELPFRVGMTSSVNPSGETQAELDVFANDLFAHALIDTGVVSEVASEEMETPMTAKSPSPRMLSVAMDPLDGSSNITTNNPLGSIFGIWRGKLPQPGRAQVAAAFVTYGPTLSLTLTRGKEVDQYIEVREGAHKDQFVRAHRAMRLPEKAEVYGIGGDRAAWTPEVKKFVEKLEARKMRLRYGGTFIGDFNQVLKRGGVFAYPMLQNKPDGKLRILYETAPISLITEYAGGTATDGRGPLLDLKPTKLAQTSPFFVGNRSLLDELRRDLSTPGPA